MSDDLFASWLSGAAAIKRALAGPLSNPTKEESSRGHDRDDGATVGYLSGLRAGTVRGRID